MRSLNGNDYAVRAVLTPKAARGKYTVVCVEVTTFGGRTSFYPWGRFKPEDLTLVTRGKYLDKLARWKRDANR